MIDSQIKEIIERLNQQYGRELTLDELLEIQKQTGIFNKISKRQGIEKFMLVHVTNYAPTDSQIKTPLQTGQSLKIETPVGEKEIKSFRDTIHFTVNTTVTSHSSGNWDKCKYAIIMPMDSFLENNGQNIESCLVVDFFISGSANLPDNAYILCPQDEVAEIKKNNPNVNVIGYHGENVVQYTNKFLEMLAITTKKCGAWSYMDDNEKDLHTQIELQTLLIQKLKKAISYLNHGAKIEHAREDRLGGLYFVLSAVNNIKNNNLLNKISEKEIKEQLIVYKTPMVWNWRDATDSKEELQRLVDEINELSISLGISVLQDWKSSERIDTNVRIYQSLKIDEFINRDIIEVYEEDMLFTNIKRIGLILDKIDNENLFEDANAMDILTSAIKHLQDDYSIVLDTVDIRKKYDDKFDLRQYQAKLDKQLIKFGINHKYLEKGNLSLTDILIKERKNKHFFDKHISPVPVMEDDFIINMLCILNKLYDLICTEARKDIKSNFENGLFDIWDQKSGDVYNEAIEIFEYIVRKLKDNLNENYLIELRKSNINIEDYLKKLEQLLNRFGIHINDFLNNENDLDVCDKVMKILDNELDAIGKDLLAQTKSSVTNSNKR